MGEKELNIRIKKLIQDAFPYGEFQIVPDAKKLKDEYRKYVEAMKYLVQEGFAINRNDIKDGRKIFRQLTDKGRLLKECGTMEEYHRQILIDKNHKIAYADRQATEALRNKYHFYITLSIGFSTLVAAIYYSIETLRIFYPSWFPKI
jgi:hypothetical protein